MNTCGVDRQQRRWSMSTNEFIGQVPLAIMMILGKSHSVEIEQS